MRQAPPTEQLSRFGQILSLSFMLLVLFMFGNQVITAARLVSKSNHPILPQVRRHFRLHIHRPWITLDIKI